MRHCSRDHHLDDVSLLLRRILIFHQRQQFLVADVMALGKLLQLLIVLLQILQVLDLVGVLLLGGQSAPCFRAGQVLG